LAYIAIAPSILQLMKLLWFHQLAALFARGEQLLASLKTQSSTSSHPEEAERLIGDHWQENTVAQNIQSQRTSAGISSQFHTYPRDRFDKNTNAMIRSKGSTSTPEAEKITPLCRTPPCLTSQGCNDPRS